MLKFTVMPPPVVILPKLNGPLPEQVTVQVLLAKVPLQPSWVSWDWVLEVL